MASGSSIKRKTGSRTSVCITIVDDGEDEISFEETVLPTGITGSNKASRTPGGSKSKIKGKVLGECIVIDDDESQLEKAVKLPAKVPAHVRSLAGAFKSGSGSGVHKSVVDVGVDNQMTVRASASSAAIPLALKSKASLDMTVEEDRSSAQPSQTATNGPQPQISILQVLHEEQTGGEAIIPEACRLGAQNDPNLAQATLPNQEDQETGLSNAILKSSTSEKISQDAADSVPRRSSTENVELQPDSPSDNVCGDESDSGGDGANSEHETDIPPDVVAKLSEEGKQELAGIQVQLTYYENKISEIDEREMTLTETQEFLDEMDRKRTKYSVKLERASSRIVRLCGLEEDSDEENRIGYAVPFSFTGSGDWVLDDRLTVFVRTGKMQPAGSDNGEVSSATLKGIIQDRAREIMTEQAGSSTSPRKKRPFVVDDILTWVLKTIEAHRIKAFEKRWGPGHVLMEDCNIIPPDDPVLLDKFNKSALRYQSEMTRASETLQCKIQHTDESVMNPDDLPGEVPEEVPEQTSTVECAADAVGPSDCGVPVVGDTAAVPSSATEDMDCLLEPDEDVFALLENVSMDDEIY